MMDRRTIGGMVAGVVIALMLTWGVACAVSGVRAQSSSRDDVAVAPGPGGMWVVRGDSVRVCIAGPIQSGVAPPAPRCGDATPLR